MEKKVPEVKHAFEYPAPGLLRHKQDRKELECDLVWHLVAVSRVRCCTTDRKE